MLAVRIRRHLSVFFHYDQSNQAEVGICWVVGLRDRFSAQASGFVLHVRVPVCVVRVCIFGGLEAEMKKYAEHQSSERSSYSSACKK